MKIKIKSLLRLRLSGRFRKAMRVRRLPIQTSARKRCFLHLFRNHFINLN